MKFVYCALLLLINVPIISLEQSTRIACVICNKTFSRRDTYFRHQDTHQESQEIQCPMVECNKISTNKRNHESHIKSFHKLHPRTLKPLQKRKPKDLCAYVACKYQSQATRNAKRMPTRTNP
jgi:uncharacterized Zn-finger protein